MIKRFMLFPFLVLVLVTAGCASSRQTPAALATATQSAPILVPNTGATRQPEASPTTAAPTATKAATTAPKPTATAKPTAAKPVASAQTYTVTVGWNDSSTGAELEAFFPAELHIHAGDTVTWKTNVPEIHTVTFPAGQDQAIPLLIPVQGGKASEMMFNPKAVFPDAPKDGKYDGSTYANSGLMGTGPNQATEFSLTFTKAGTYSYFCIVHGQMMPGKIVVTENSASVDTPEQASAQGQKEIDALKAKIPDAVKAAQAAVKPDKKNSDGSTTHYVLVGYAQGQIDLMAFFPNKLPVKPGDTIEWYLPDQGMAPHTITFLNGAKEPELTVQKPQAGGPPQIEFNPDVVLPQNADKPLSSQGIYNSGLIDPQSPGPHTFTLKVDKAASGTLTYQCLLHDESGMKGEIEIEK